MSRFLKVLSVAAVAVLSLAAVSSASAAKFHAEGSTTTSFSGSQIGTDVFKTDGGTVECEEAIYSGSQTGSEVATVKVTPKYSNCSALSGFAPATIDMNECEYEFTEPTGTGPTTYTGQVHIVCPLGKEITVTASLFGTTKCVVHIPPQGPHGTITYHNEGTGTTRDIKVTSSVLEISYTETEGTGFGRCAENQGTHHNTNGTYTGETTITGFHVENKTTTHTGIWIA